MANRSITQRPGDLDGTAIALLACVGLVLTSAAALLATSEALPFLRTLSMQGVLPFPL